MGSLLWIRKKYPTRQWVTRAIGMLAGFALLAATLLTGPTHASERRYIFNTRGKILAVVEPDGSTTTWIRDQNDDVLSVERFDVNAIPGKVGITLVIPSSAKPSEFIEIVGKGFSTARGGNAVTFNRVPATKVLPFTKVSILVEVPAGATTGFIHVITPLGHASSPLPFRVLLPPTTTEATTM